MHNGAQPASLRQRRAVYQRTQGPFSMCVSLSKGAIKGTMLHVKRYKCTRGSTRVRKSRVSWLQA